MGVALDRARAVQERQPRALGRHRRRDLAHQRGDALGAGPCVRHRLRARVRRQRGPRDLALRGRIAVQHAPDDPGALLPGDLGVHPEVGGPAHAVGAEAQAEQEGVHRAERHEAPLVGERPEVQRLRDDRVHALPGDGAGQRHRVRPDVGVRGAQVGRGAVVAEAVLHRDVGVGQAEGGVVQEHGPAVQPHPPVLAGAAQLVERPVLRPGLHGRGQAQPVEQVLRWREVDAVAAQRQARRAVRGHVPGLVIGRGHRDASHAVRRGPVEQPPRALGGQVLDEDVQGAVHRQRPAYATKSISTRMSMRSEPTVVRTG